MTVLHTADWHLGRALYGRTRYHEYSQFLNWLLAVLAEEKVDVLLLAGDVFDSGTPSNRAQQLYYRFLSDVADTGCRHVVIIAGNHDSPTFLSAPRDLLRASGVHVIGASNQNKSEEVVVLSHQQQVEAVVCAVPYLRDRDIRTFESGEGIDEKNAKLVAGVKQHYAEVCSLAQQKCDAIESAGQPRPPLLAMGHLFTAGGQTVEGDGVRELYVGSLAHVEKDVFPPAIDYLALGHLHVPQRVGQAEQIRYSGSPLPMGFGEANQRKKVVLVRFQAGARRIEEREVPCFQQLVQVKGNREEILDRVAKLQSSPAWLEIVYTDPQPIGDLRQRLEELCENQPVEILRIKSPRSVLVHSASENETLDDLSPDQVFQRCLEQAEVAADDRPALMARYHQILVSVYQQDRNAE